MYLQFASHFSDNYVRLCTIEAELTSIPIRTKRNSRGKQFYEIDYEIPAFLWFDGVKCTDFMENIGGG